MPVHAQSVHDDYALAAGYYAREQWNEAATAFAELLQAYPETEQSTLARFFAAEVMMQQGQFENGFLAFQSFLKEFPHHSFVPRATFRMGEAAYRIDQYEIALRMLEEFVKKNPYHELTEFALPYLGEMRLKREEPQLSQRAFETALKMYPASQLSNSCRLGLAKAFQLQGLNNEAQRFYEFLLTGSDSDLAGEAKLQLGILSFGRKDLPSAETYLTGALSNCKSAHSQAKATYWLARTHIELEDYERAIELLKTISVSNVPEKLAASALFDGAIAAHRLGRDSLALEWLGELRKTFPKNMMVDDALRMEIDIHQENGATNRTLPLIQEFRKQHEHSPMRVGVLEAEGRSQYSEKRFEKSIDLFALLLDDHSNDPNVTKFDRANWFYLKSLGHLGLGDFSGAQESLSQIDSAMQTDALKPLVQIAWATTRFGQENYFAAVENYRRYLRLLPNGAESKRARTELTISLAELGRWTECAEAFEELRDHHPEQAVVLTTARYLAEKAYQKKQLQFAEQWFEVMANSKNDNNMLARGLSGLAWIKMETDDTEAAYLVFERLLTECPNGKFSGEAAMACAKHLEDRRDLEEAAQMYGLVIRRFGKSPLANVAKLRRAHCLQKVGGKVNLEESKTLLLDYLKVASQDSLIDEAIYQLAWLLHDLGEKDLAYARFSELVESCPDSKYWSDAAYRMAQQSFAQQDFEQANGLLARLLDRDDAPTIVIAQALFLQGQIAAREKRWNAATESMQELILNTEDPRLKTKAKYWLAESYYQQKKYVEAWEHFEQLVEVGELDTKLEPWIWLRAAQCRGYETDWPRAVELAEDGRQKFPDFPSAYEFDFVLGRGLEDAGKLTDARFAYQRIVDSRSGGATETAAIAQWRIGETYFHQEQYVDAIKAYYKVHSLFSYAHWRSAALIQAGKCQEHLRKNKHALKLYLQLIQNFPDSEFVDEAQTRIDRLTRQAMQTPAADTKNRR